MHHIASARSQQQRLPFAKFVQFACMLQMLHALMSHAVSAVYWCTVSAHSSVMAQPLCIIRLYCTLHAMQGLEDTLPSSLQRLSGPPFPLPTAGSSVSSPMGTSLLLTAPLFCRPPAPPRRELPTTAWCTTRTVTTSSEAESALSAEVTLSLQQMLTSVQQQQASVYSLACQSSQPISSPEELLARLTSGQIDSFSSSGPGLRAAALGGSRYDR